MLFTDTKRPKGSCVKGIRSTLLAIEVALLELRPGSQDSSPLLLEHSTHVQVPAQLVKKGSLEWFNLPYIKELLNRIIELRIDLALYTVNRR